MLYDGFYFSVHAVSPWAGGLRLWPCAASLSWLKAVVRPRCRETCVLRLRGAERRTRCCPHSLSRRKTPQPFKIDKRRLLSWSRLKDFGKSGQGTCLALTEVEIEHKASVRCMLISLNHRCSEPLPTSERDPVGLMKIDSLNFCNVPFFLAVTVTAL